MKSDNLPLLRIELHQRADNGFLHSDLILGITGIELAALDPLGVALLPQCELSLRFGNLLGKGDHGDSSRAAKRPGGVVTPQSRPFPQG